MAGDGSGAFNPTSKLTGYAFAKMLLCASGYDAAEYGMLGTTWQSGVDFLANENNIFQGNAGTDKALPATREEAALYAYNALKSRMIKELSIDKYLPDYELTKYTYQTDKYTYGYYVVTNNTDSAIAVDGKINAYDASGKLIGVSGGNFFGNTIEFLGPGEICGLEMPLLGTDCSRIWYGISFSEPKLLFEPILDNISLTTTTNDDNVIVQVTNNGTAPSTSLYVSAVFFDDKGNPIDSDYDAVSDFDGELKPGHTITVRLDAEKPFSGVEYYLNGESFEYTFAKISNVPESKVVTEEFSFDNTEFDYYIHFISVTNKSSTKLGVYVNAIAYDAEGNIVDATDDKIYAIGAGDTALVSLKFTENGTTIDRVKYYLQYSEEAKLSPPSLRISHKKLDSTKIGVTLNNLGSKTYELVTALFFDAKGNVVDYDNEFIQNIESSVTIELESDVAFDDYKVFV